MAPPEKQARKDINERSRILPSR